MEYPAFPKRMTPVFRQSGIVFVLCNFVFAQIVYISVLKCLNENHNGVLCIGVTENDFG